MVEAELLAAILADPDDDAPRLVLADQLMQRGDPRGELIAVSCALASHELDDEARRALRERERRLLFDHESAWLAPLGIAGSQVTWRRGFVERVELPWPRLAATWRGLVAQTPLRGFHVWLEGARDVQALGAEPWPRTLSSLSLAANRLDRARTEALAAAPLLGQLTSLELGRCSLDDDAIATLAGSNALGALVHLDLRGNQLTGAGARSLAAAPCLTALRRLDLEHNLLGDDGARALAAAERWKLTSLDLARTGIGPDGAAALAESPHLDELQRLALGRNELAAAGIAALAASRRLPGLSSLEISANDVRADGAQAIARSSTLHALRELDLTANALGDAGVRAIAGSAALPGLRRLNLSQNAIGADGAYAIASSPHLRALVALDLSSNGMLGPRGARALAARSRPSSLRRLALDGCGIGDDGVVELAAGLEGLRELEVSSNKIGLRGARALASCASLQALSLVQLARNPLNKQAQRILRTELGDRVQF